MAWRILVQLFYVAVVVLVFTSLNDAHETLAVALFGMIYVTLRLGIIGLALSMQGMAMGIDRQFESIKMHVVPDYIGDDEELASSQSIVDQSVTRSRYEYAGLGIISLICLFEIFSSLSGRV